MRRVCSRRGPELCDVMAIHTWPLSVWLAFPHLALSLFPLLVGCLAQFLACSFVHNSTLHMLPVESKGKCFFCVPMCRLRGNGLLSLTKCAPIFFADTCLVPSFVEHSFSFTIHSIFPFSFPLFRSIFFTALDLNLLSCSTRTQLKKNT